MATLSKEQETRLRYLYENKEVYIFATDEEKWNETVNSVFRDTEFIKIGNKSWIVDRLLYELHHGYYPLEDEDFVSFRKSLKKQILGSKWYKSKSL